MMRRMILALALAATMVASLPVTAFAHGHGRQRASQTYALCTVGDCSITGNHQHNGTTYTGHFVGDGHNYHQVCTVQNCTEAGSHMHNGTTCLPHNNNDGHSYHSGGHHH